MVAVELIFFPGTIALALSGLALMFVSLLWSMADIWPNQPLNFSGDLLVAPLEKLFLGLLVAGASFWLVVRILPRGWMWDRMAIQGAVRGAGVIENNPAETKGLVGAEGIAVTDLFPSGRVEIDGRRYEARLEVGFAPAGALVRVIRRTDFNLVVETIGS
jgi:membrane-bound serine protease (ClpP class)